MPRGRRSPARLPQVHPLVPVLVAVVVAGLLVVAVAVTGGDDGDAAPEPTSTTATVPSTSTSTSTTLPAPVDMEALLAPAPAVTAPSAYRITYEVVENGLPRVEEWTVRRPYESLVVSTRDGAMVSGTSTSRGRLQTFLSDREGWLPVQPELHRAAFDLRPAAPVAAMEALGLVERVAQGERLGRACTVYRTGQPVGAGTVTAPTEQEETHVCIDGAGLVLHERWAVGGTTVLERTATGLELDPEIDPAMFEPGPVVDDADELSAAFATIAVAADEETLARLQTEVPVPDGYVRDGAVFRGAGGGPGAPGSGAPAAAETVRFWSRGPDLLEVAEVFTDGGASLASDDAVPVAVEDWDEVWFEPDFRVSLLRARLDDSTYVELRHHDVALLFDLLRSLQRVDR